MKNKLFEICRNTEKEFEHKKKIDWAYYLLDLFSMIANKITPFCLELLKLRMQKTNLQKSWQNIINLKSGY